MHLRAFSVVSVWRHLSLVMIECMLRPSLLAAVCQINLGQPVLWFSSTCDGREPLGESGFYELGAHFVTEPCQNPEGN